jgi:hypothetical protein
MVHKEGEIVELSLVHKALHDPFRCNIGVVRNEPIYIKLNNRIEGN